MAFRVLVTLASLPVFALACSKPTAPPAADAAFAVEAPAKSASPPASEAASAGAAASALASSTPDVVTHASMVWDGGSPASGSTVVASGSIDGAALREAHRARLAADVSPVVVLAGGTATPRALGEKLCSQVVPKRPPETPILLKPNIGGFDWFKDPKKSGGDDGLKGRITDPEFVRGVVQCLKKRGHTRVTIAEGWGAAHKDWERLMRESGYAAMAKEEGVPLVGMDDDGVFDVQGDTPGKPLAVTGMEATHTPTLLIPKILAEHLQHGMFISIPKLKAHRFAVFSLGIKGMQGTAMLSDASPAYRQKWRMHKELNAALALQKSGDEGARAAYVAALETFAERMVDVTEIEAPDVVLVDGLPAMGGDGFGKLYPMPDHVAIGGTNVVRVDRVGAGYLGLYGSDALAKALGGHRTSPLLEVAAKRFGVDIGAPSMTGDGVALFAKARPVHFVAMAPFAIHTDPFADGGAPQAGDDGSSQLADGGSAWRPTVHAASLGKDTITIDGSGAEAAWARAPQVSFATDYAGTLTDTVTRARFLWSPTALYALFDLEGAGLNTDTSRPIADERARLYQEDCVELFVAPDEAHRDRYYEIELGPFGHFLDIALDRTAKKSDVAWSSGARIGTTRDAAARTATIEVAIPAKEITDALAAGRTLPLGLYRMEGQGNATRPRKYLAWSPPRTPKPDFHVPAAFGSLVLDK